MSLLYLAEKRHLAILYVLLIALPIMLLNGVRIIKRQASGKLPDHASHIDLIIGRDGNPLQITLSTMFYHSDIPKAGVSVEVARNIVRNRAVRLAVPMILGEEYRGFRIVGTNHNYLEIYNGKLETGELWQSPMEVVLGYRAARKLNLEVGDPFSPELGSDAAATESGYTLYKVKGTLKKSGTVIDNAIITGLESFWQDERTLSDNNLITGEDQEVNSENTFNVFPFEFPDNVNENLTAILIQYRSPMAALTYPEFVQRESGFITVQPGLEIMYLVSLIRRFTSYFNIMAIVIILLVFWVVYMFFLSLVKERSADFAIFSVVGTKHKMIPVIVLLMAVFVADSAAVTGILFGHIVADWVIIDLPFARMTGLTGWSFSFSEIGIYFATHLGVLLAAAYPSMKVYRMDVLSTLTRE